MKKEDKKKMIKEGRDKEELNVVGLRATYMEPTDRERQKMKNKLVFFFLDKME